jgi:very-short-patch-repair endonuclease
MQMNKTEEFIRKARLKHGDKYDYSKVEYVSGKLHIIIICKTHGQFTQTAGSHLHGCGCKICGDILRGKNRKYNSTDFVNKLYNIHGDYYDYSKVNYTGIYDKITIICKEHGEFIQTASNHLRGSGCQKCYDERRGEKIRKTTDEFIEKAKSKHGNRYDYSKCNYISIDDKLTIICSIHGEFQQVAYSHISGQGCKKCGVIKRGEMRRSNTEEFIEKAIQKHGDKYDYSKVEYIASNIPIVIICKTHGEFTQAPANHTNSGYGCPLCTNKTEGKIFEKLKKIYPSIITQFKKEWCKNKFNLPFDFCIPEYSIIIELDGRQHFIQVRDWQSPEEQFETDKFKQQCANNNNYSTIRLLQEDVLYDKYDWCKELCDAIEEIKQGDDVVNIYLCKNGEYDNF